MSKLFLRMRKYLLNLALLLDIAINVIMLGGSPYETISSRVGKRRPSLWACRFCKVLDTIFGKQHCDNSAVPDYGKTLPNWWKFGG